jgi:DNA polymerase-1
MYMVVTVTSEVRKYLGGAKKFGFDFETAPDELYRNDDKAALDPHKAHIVGISFSVAEGSAIYIPLAHKVGKNIEDSAALWEYLAKLFSDTTVEKCAHNLTFESAFLYARGIVVQEPCFDTIAAAQLTFKGNAGFRKLADSGLKTLVPEILDVELPTFSEVTSGRHFDELDPSDAETVRYACADSDYTLILRDVFCEWFDRWLPRHRYIVEKIESPTAVFCGIMKYNGLLVDSDMMNTKATECKKRIEELKDEMAFIIGEVSIGANCSTSAFKQYLYKDLGLPVMKVTSKYQEAADDETLVLLSEWCGQNRPELVPLFTLIQEYRKVGKIYSTYIEGYQKHINSATGRIHADLMPLATETGRFAARNPNLQNMPRAGADDVGVRNFFIAPEDKVIVSVDLSQIELRIGAFYCRDERMLETYRTGGDIHNQTADVVFGVKKHDKEERTIAKNINFGTFYGLFPNGLQRTLKFKAGLDAPIEKCEEIIKNLKAGYPALTVWQKETIRNAARNRYTETWLGRRRYLPNINSPDWGKKSFSERCALNTPIQGTAADLLKQAIGRILEGLPDRLWLMPLLQIHDELCFEVPEQKVDEAIAFIMKCMQAQPFPECDIPILAEASVGVRFGEMKGV